MNEDNNKYNGYDNAGFGSVNDASADGSAKPTRQVTTYTYGPTRSASDISVSYEKQLEQLRNQNGGGPDGFGSGSGSGDGGKPPHKEKRTSAKAVFAAFLAGAIVIGGFMYTADRNNLFTGGNESTVTNNAIVSNSAGQGSGLQTASVSVESNIADIYAAASPAVVKIENYTEPARSVSRGSDYWQYFSQQFPQQQGGGQQQEEQSQTQEDETDTTDLELSGSGTGFIFKSSGYILTNEHVIADAKQVKVTVEGYDEPFIATVVGSDEDKDLAVLKIEGTQEFPTLELGDSDNTAIGDWVIAIGNPYGFDHTMTVGVLSAKERPITISDESGDHLYEHLLQTDASINPGNSGGPLLNASGQVIGINTAVNSEAQGIGFAIPTSTITETVKTLMSNSL